MKSIRTLLLTAVFALSSTAAFAAIPWGSTAPLQVSGATPTCTYTSTALACIENMTAPVTAITLAGMTAGVYYSIILMQDGTGSRALTQASITGAPALTTAESAANGYAVWLIKATSASAATFIQDYPNAPLFNVFAANITGNGTTVTTAAVQAQPTVVAPGMTASNSCSCVFTNPDTNYNKGFTMGCVPLTNAVVCNEINATATSGTPTAGTIAVRIAP